MSFIVPTLQSTKNAILDYAETLALIRGYISLQDVISDLGLSAEDNDENDIMDSKTAYIEEAFSLVGDRISLTSNNYPFMLDKQGYCLQCSQKKDWKLEFYKFMLFCSSLNMQNDRKLESIDAGKVFERATKHSLHGFLGDFSNVEIFGTGNLSGISFQERVTNLCRLSNEGIRFKDNIGNASDKKDDKIDLVGWIPFQNPNPIGQLFIFGQCATGVHIDNKISETRPDAFIKRWFSSPLPIDPIPAFFSVNAFNDDKFRYYTSTGILLFDRFRIMSFTKQIDLDVLKDISLWNKAAEALISGVVG